LTVSRSLIQTDQRLRVIELRRNFGQTAALQAGLDAAHGEILITMDADLQHFPEEIPLFLEKIAEGFDMVCGWRHRRAEGIIRRWPSRVANLLIKMITGLPFHDFGTTFRAYRADFIKDLKLFGEFHRFVPALGYDMGGRIAEIPIENIDRPAGKSNYGISRTLGVFLDLIVLFFFIRYIDRPMRAFGKIAILFFGVGAVILTYMVIVAYTDNYPMFKEHPGFALSSVMLVLTAVQALFVGILAEILTRIHFGVDNRRVYKIRREWNYNKTENC